MDCSTELVLEDTLGLAKLMVALPYPEIFAIAYLRSVSSNENLFSNSLIFLSLSISFSLKFYISSLIVF